MRVVSKCVVAQDGGVSEIVNLRQARKRKQRTEAARVARENRVVHGQTPEQKRAAASEAERRARLLDSKKLE